MSITVTTSSCGDCGATWEVIGGFAEQHVCTAPGNPTPFRIHQRVQVPTSDGGLVPGVITGIRYNPSFGGEGSADVYVPAWQFRTVPVSLGKLTVLDVAA